MRELCVCIGSQDLQDLVIIIPVLKGKWWLVQVSKYNFFLWVQKGPFLLLVEHIFWCLLQNAHTNTPLSLSYTQKKFYWSGW